MSKCVAFKNAKVTLILKIKDHTKNVIL